MKRTNVSLTIDGVKTVVPEGTTVLKAAETVGIEILHLCYHEKLSPPSACRLCVVEIKGARTLVASCARPVEEGMEVKTNTERVTQARKVVLELLLSDHPADCLTCETCGSCKLQDYAYAYQVTANRFLGERHNYVVDHSNPFIERDFNRCIVCGRCSLVCKEIQYCYVIDHMNRGFDTMVTSALDRPLPETPCVYCGRCVSVCPVGALTEKVSRFKGRDRDLQKVPTTCPYCGVGCNLELNVYGGRIVKVTSNEESPVNGGCLCVKGRFGFEFVNHPDRLKFPLIRKPRQNSAGSASGRNGKLTPPHFGGASWDEAISLISKKLKETKKKYGPDSIGILSSAKCTNEENYLMQRFARAVIGTNNIDHCARLCHAPTVAGLAMAFGSGAMTNPMSDIGKADVVLVTGSNTTRAHPVLALEIIGAVKNGAKLIVIEPRRIDLVDHASLWLSQRPGTDVAVLNGLMNAIISEGLVDKKFIGENTGGFSAVEILVKKYTPEVVEKISGVPAEKIRQAARLYGKAERGSIIFSMGITQHTTGVDNVLSIANLAMMTGNIGRPGTGVNPLRGQNNVQGACDMGALPDVLPGYQKITDDEARKVFEAAWSKRLPAEPGLTVVEMMDAARQGKLKAMYIMGENPMLSDPDISHVEEALKNLDFLVVQDIFLTETAQLADVVLPGTSFAEKSGTFTNTERRVQPVREAIKPIGESIPDWKIIGMVSKAMGYKMDYLTPAEITDEVAQLTPQYRGILARRVEACGIHWPCPTPDHAGTPILHKDGKFTRGKGKFHPVEFKPPAEVPDKEYPLYLTTGRYLYQYHTGTMTRRVRGLEETAPIGWAEINPADALKYKILDGALVTVATRRGKIKTKAKVTEDSPRGTIFLSFHYAEAPANRLTNPALDPVAKIAELKVSACKIHPA